MALYFHTFGTMESNDAIGALAALAKENAPRDLPAAGAPGPTVCRRARSPSGSRFLPPTLSFHLAQLDRAGLVTRGAKGRSILYAADYRGMNALLAFLTEDCCQGRPICGGRRLRPQPTPQLPTHRRRPHEAPARPCHRRATSSNRSASTPTLFGAEPTVLKTDYAKWMLEDPRVNFAISQRGGDRARPSRHPGRGRRRTRRDRRAPEQPATAGARQKATTCCYARSDKAWVVDPEGVAWETFHTLGESTVYGEDEPAKRAAEGEASACCAPIRSRRRPHPAAPSRGAAARAVH